MFSPLYLYFGSFYSLCPFPPKVLFKWLTLSVLWVKLWTFADSIYQVQTAQESRLILDLCCLPFQWNLFDSVGCICGQSSFFNIWFWKSWKFVGRLIVCWICVRGSFQPSTLYGSGIISPWTEKIFVEPACSEGDNCHNDSLVYVCVSVFAFMRPSVRICPDHNFYDWGWISK